MCLQDLIIAEMSQEFEFPAVVGNADTPIIGADPGRTVLYLGPPDSGNVLYTFRRAATAAIGFVVNTGDAPLRFSYIDDANLMRSEVRAFGSAGNQTVYIAGATIPSIEEVIAHVKRRL